MVTFAEPSSAPFMLEAYHYDPDSDPNSNPNPNPNPRSKPNSDQDQDWTPIVLCKHPSSSSSELRLITWNLNAGGPAPTKRFARILKHLRNSVFQNATPKASCILFQEVHVETLQAILDNRWIREHFVITPNSGNSWTTAYGLVSLVSKDIPVSRVFYVELPLTRVGRHALFIDVHLSSSSSSSASSSSSDDDSSPISPLSGSSSASASSSEASFLAQTNRTIRIANTHLEPESSGGFRIRPKQLRTIAQMLNVANVHAFICAGSMVSVQEIDHKTPAQLGLADAYVNKGIATGSAMVGVTVRGSETWGRTPHRLDLPPGRLDKVLYFPTEWVEVECPKRIGDMFMPLDEVFPSDHYGLVSVVKVRK